MMPVNDSKRIVRSWPGQGTMETFHEAEDGSVWRQDRGDGMSGNVKQFLESQGYKNVRQLPGGEWLWTQRMMFTTGICLGNEHVRRTRFCYEDHAEAERVAADWDGNGWPPGYWVKQKPEDIHGPASTDKLAERRWDASRVHDPA